MANKGTLFKAGMEAAAVECMVKGADTIEACAVLNQQEDDLLAPSDDSKAITAVSGAHEPGDTLKNITNQFNPDAFSMQQVREIYTELADRVEMGTWQELGPQQWKNLVETVDSLRAAGRYNEYTPDEGSSRSMDEWLDKAEEVLGDFDMPLDEIYAISTRGNEAFNQVRDNPENFNLVEQAPKLEDRQDLSVGDHVFSVAQL